MNNNEGLIMFLCYIILAIIVGVKTAEAEGHVLSVMPYILALFSPVVFPIMVIKMVFFTKWWED